MQLLLLVDCNRKPRSENLSESVEKKLTGRNKKKNVLAVTRIVYAPGHVVYSIRARTAEHVFLSLFLLLFMIQNV